MMAGLASSHFATGVVGMGMIVDGRGAPVADDGCLDGLD